MEILNPQHSFVQCGGPGQIRARVDGVSAAGSLGPLRRCDRAEWYSHLIPGLLGWTVLCCATAVAQPRGPGLMPRVASGIPAAAFAAEESSALFVPRDPAGLLTPVPDDFPPLLRTPRVTASRGVPTRLTAGADERTIDLMSLSSAEVVGDDTDRGASARSDAPFLDLTSTVESQPSEAPLEQPAIDTRQTIRIVAWLVVLLCGFSLVIAGLRRWQRSQGLLPVVGGQSRVMETLSLGPGRTVSLIELSGIRALVGSDAGGIRAIVIAPAAFREELSRYGVEGMPQESAAAVSDGTI